MDFLEIQKVKFLSCVYKILNNSSLVIWKLNGLICTNTIKITKNTFIFSSFFYVALSI